MKFLVLIGLIALSAAAPQPRKLFHEHFEDFVELIMEEAAHDIEHLMGHYLEFEEFTATLDYLSTQNFRDIIYELESLPEFKAMVEFLEKDNIDILYFIDLYNDMLEDIREEKRQRNNQQPRHTLSGTDMSAFIKDTISEFPKAKLAALFEEKKTEDPEFKMAIDNLNSEEWRQIWGALWESETFLKELEDLQKHGIYLDIIVEEIVAVFGQN